MPRKLLARVRRLDLVVEAAALVAQRLDAVLEHRIERRPVGPRRPRIDGADDEPRVARALDPQRRGIEAGREIARAKHAAALRQVDMDDAGDGGAVGIDRDGIDLRADVGLCRRRRDEHGEAQERRCNSHESLPKNGLREANGGPSWADPRISAPPLRSSNAKIQTAL